ncbi:MAG TPA: DUF2145 domain-containing protein [Ramlibacter sp.]|nr:DUF2145 domain-containing protein [Ramlibacter sp.]
MKPIIVLRWVLGALVLAAAATAQAGRSCEQHKLTPQTLERGLQLSERIHHLLEAEHARHATRVVMLARAGQDLTRYNLRYSHLGFAYRDSSADGAPAWRVLHKLNQCGSAEGSLYRQGLAEFFLDDLWRQEAAWSMLAPDLQARLLPLLRDNTAVARLHHKPYSMVSYPWSTRYQQSNQWAIETLALAQPQPAANRAQAQAWLFEHGYQPTTLRLGPLTRLGARATAANVAFDDHPSDKRFADRIETATVDSIFAWLPASRLGGPPVRATAQTRVVE